MDRWVEAIASDDTSACRSRARWSRTSPTTSATAATTAPATRSPTALCRAGVVHVYGTPRTVAGDAITTDTNKCRLQAARARRLRRPRSPTRNGPQLQATFPEGVCDFSKPGVGQQDTIAWQTYQRRNGDVIYGGKPLGPAPKSTAIKP